LGGPLEGPVLQQGELSMVCVGFSKRDLKNFGGPGFKKRPEKFWGARKNFGGVSAPLEHP